MYDLHCKGNRTKLLVNALSTWRQTIWAAWNPRSVHLTTQNSTWEVSRTPVHLRSTWFSELSIKTSGQRFLSALLLTKLVHHFHITTLKNLSFQSYSGCLSWFRDTAAAGSGCLSWFHDTASAGSYIITGHIKLEENWVLNMKSCIEETD